MRKSVLSLKSGALRTSIVFFCLIWSLKTFFFNCLIWSHQNLCSFIPLFWLGVVGWCEGVLYLTSPGRPTVLAYSWARPAILVAGKGRGGCFYFFCFFTFISVPLSSLSLSFISSTISSIFFLPFSGRRHKMTHKG